MTSKAYRSGIKTKLNSNAEFGHSVELLKIVALINF